MGNSGSGKTTLAGALALRHGLEHLDLDAIVWEPGSVAVQRPDAAVRQDLDAFIAARQDWVIEGCYGELIEAALPHCTELLFLNPPVDRCLARNAARAWEPAKYRTPAAQDAMRRALASWTSSYAIRDDAWSLAAHRRIFDAFRGEKREIVE